MAVIGAAQISNYRMVGGPTGEATVDFTIANVSSADTLDLSAGMGPIPACARGKWSCWGPSGDAGGGVATAAILTALAGGATGTNNKATFTLASMVNAMIQVKFTGVF